MGEPVKEWGDVASTTSLTHYLAYHARHHHDVREVEYGPDGNDSAVKLLMADGSDVTVKVTSNHSERLEGQG